MKKIGKLEFNSEKIMRNEELITLRGGYSSCTCTCFNWETYCCYGYLLSGSGDCNRDCSDVFGFYATGVCGNIYPCDVC
jgi:natural product precursor